MKNTVLITGGAGFIGQHLAKRLLVEGYNVRILDNFSEQVHSENSKAQIVAAHAEVIRGDIRDRAILKSCIKGVDTVVHLAAETGTGQSMYEIEKYFSVNVQGTALLLDVLQNEKDASSVSCIVVASSRAIYGEGQYGCALHGNVFPSQRDAAKMRIGNFEVFCPHCGSDVELQKTSEKVPFQPLSYYGLTKQVQEQAVLMYASISGISGYGLRYQNVYGPGQSLKNPYTGILAIFSNLARQNSPIRIFEDGLESRDFVYIDDVVEATFRSIDSGKNQVCALNVGSGIPTTVHDVAKKIQKFFNSESRIIITGEFRIGDIRHNIADVSLMSEILDYNPRVGFDEGLHQFLSWAAHEPSTATSAYEASVREMADRGLMG